MNRAEAPPLRRVWRSFAPTFWRHRHDLALAYLYGAVAVVAALAAPWPLKFIIDSVLAHEPLRGSMQILLSGLSPAHQVIALAAAAALAGASVAIAGARQKVRNAQVRERLALDLRDQILAHVLRQPPSIRTLYRSGDLVHRVVGDVNLFARLQTKTLPVIFHQTATAVGVLVIVGALQPVLAGTCLLMLPPFFLLMRRYGPRLGQAARTKRGREGDLAGVAQEIVRGLPALQMTAADADIRQRFTRVNSASLEAGVAETRLAVHVEALMQVGQALAVAFITGGGALFVLRGPLSIGTLTLLLSYAVALLKPIEKINDLASAVTRGLAAAGRLQAVLDQDGAVRDAPDALETGRVTGHLELRDIDFTYPSGDGASQPVLHGANLCLEPGQLTVLVGRSGAGKSTLISLLLRVFDPQAGHVLLDGRPLPAYTLASLRRQYAVLTQDTHLFAGTVRDALGRSGHSDDDGQCWDALRLVDLADTVAARPTRLDTPLGEDGLNLSGGQRRRLALARAFLLDRPILVLDEPLANVDRDSGAVIVAALERMRTGRTCLVVTHRAEIATHADAVYEIDPQGRIVQTRDARLAGSLR